MVLAKTVQNKDVFSTEDTLRHLEVFEKHQEQTDTSPHSAGFEHVLSHALTFPAT